MIPGFLVQRMVSDAGVLPAIFMVDSIASVINNHS
jgi:hypothetical protein